MLWNVSPLARSEFLDTSLLFDNRCLVRLLGLVRGVIHLLNLVLLLVISLIKTVWILKISKLSCVIFLGLVYVFNK